MYVCVCNAVSDKQIVKAAREGACCMRELRERLGVGARCGKCIPTAREVLHAHAAPGHASADATLHQASSGLPRVIPVVRVRALAA